MGFRLLIALTLLAGVAGATPGSGEAYRGLVTEWHERWEARPKTHSRREEPCIALWQLGESIRDEAKGTEVPAKYDEYHAALVTFIEATMAVADECLLKPRGGPNYMTLYREARKKRFAIGAANKAGKLGLPVTW